MSDFYSSGYKKAYVDVPSAKINPGEQSGDVRVLYCNYAAAAEANVTDVIYLGKLPAGARVIGGKVKCPATGATGILKIGVLANGVDSADDDAFGSGYDPGAAAVEAALSGEGIGQKFGAETTVVAVPTEITAALSGKTLQVWLEYVII